MKVGDTVFVGRGDYKGLNGRITRVLKYEYRIRCTHEFDDDGGSDNFFCIGDVNDVPKDDIDAPKTDMKTLENQIREKSVELAGLILKKKVLLDPDGAMKKVERILETMDV